VAGKVPVRRNPVHQVGRRGQANQPRAGGQSTLSGWEGPVANVADPSSEFVIGTYRRLFQIEASFRMSKHDLAAPPIYNQKHESIDAHLSIVLAALAVGRLVEDRTGWSIRKFVRNARHYRTVHIHAGQHLILGEEPLPDDLRGPLALITRPEGAH
jgi:hypothetical protein